MREEVGVGARSGLFTRRVAGVLLAVTTVAGLAVAPLAGAGSGPVDIAHLRLHVATTSDWTQVRLGPGTVQAVRVMGRSGDAKYARTEDGIALTDVQGSADITVELVFSDFTLAPSYTLTAWKGFGGRTVVTLANLNSGTQTHVGSLVDEVHSITDGRNTATATLAHDTLMTSQRMRMPHADKRRLVLAFYYPWFSRYDAPTLADRPTEPRSVYKYADVLDMTRQARRHGVDGFVVSYAGDQHDGTAFDKALAAARRTGQLVTGYIETPRATSLTSRGAPDAGVVTRWINQLLKRRGSAAFLKAPDGRPVVFVYGMSRLSASAWRTISDDVRSATGVRVHLVGDALGWDYLPSEWGLHRYDALESAASLTRWNQRVALLARAWSVVDPAIAPRLLAGTVSPGFDDTRLRGDKHPVIERGAGGRYDRTWTAALAGRPDWILVTSWNEWYEDTQIEPGVRSGRTALRQTAEHAAAFGG